MANRIQSLLQRGMEVLKNALDNPTITYLGTAYECIPSDERRGMELEVGGHVQTVSLTVYVSKVDLPGVITMDSVVHYMDGSWTMDSGGTEPLPKKQVARPGRTYRIGQVSEDASGAYWQLDLVGKDQ